MKKIVVSMAFAAICLQGMAGGFKIALQGQKQIGMAGCGTGLALDASSVYFNPGAIVHTQNQITGGVSFLVPRGQFIDMSTQTITNAVNQTFTPLELYGTYGINKKLTAGLGIYTPFGSGVKYPSNWTGRYILTDISLQAIFIQPTISYAINKQLSVGAGFIYATGHVNLEKDLPLQGQTFTNPGHLQLKGAAGGTGFNAGVYFAEDNFSAGLVYRSSLGMKVTKGTNTFTNIPAAAAASFPTGTFTSTLKLPGELDFGMGYKLTKKLQVALDINYTMWKVYDSLKFDFATNTDKLKDEASARLYNNSFAVRIGANYAVNTQLAMRGGMFYDMTPIDDAYVGPELPDNNKTGLCLGASYAVNNKLTIDASLLYENVAKRTTTNTASNLSGTYQTKVIAPGIGVSYRFAKNSTK
jgi:long-chain fatty acid transport protein